MKQKGFTLIELLIVVAIIGIIAAVAIPNVLMAIQRGKQKGSMGDIKTLSTSVSAYVIDKGYAPDAADMQAVLQIPNFNTFYASGSKVIDGWGQIFGYTRFAVTGATIEDAYSIGTGGKDGSGGAGGFGNTGFYVCDQLVDFKYDIVFCNGGLTYGPSVNN
jgi:type II secretion system protein G